ncbi:hypothetical protein ANN_23340 [Periplaneta americana]|uniref:Uncharacterized protein n=1 Tax=Periplaneta americana TaxID=6978 RepID=A0ABQ8SKT9_PERAM|nr:hypothetical protein ANN_23340 [Periplaneta americana]
MTGLCEGGNEPPGSLKAMQQMFETRRQTISTFLFSIWISKNNGTVTIDHFARVLNYLGIMVSAEDFNLLIKKFVKDSYTLNYVAFVAYLDQIIKYMDRKQLLDLGGDVLLQWPGRAISAELPKLPRPEIGKIRAASIFGLQSIFHPALEPPVQCEDLERLIRRIQQHIYYNRIRTTEFFKVRSNKRFKDQFIGSFQQQSGTVRNHREHAQYRKSVPTQSEPVLNRKHCSRAFQQAFDTGSERSEIVGLRHVRKSTRDAHAHKLTNVSWILKKVT